MSTAPLEYQDREKLIEVKTLQLSTKSASGTVLNGDKKSLIVYNIRDYIDFESDPNVDYVEVGMPYACIPNSSYNISDKNNVLDISFNGSTSRYTFTNGNYTYATFMPLFTSTVHYSFSISYNAITSKYTISNATYTFQLLSTSTIDYLIGFSGTVSSNASAPATLTMLRCVDFLPEPVFNICSPEISNGQALAKGGVFQFSNILATIPNAGKLNYQTVYQNTGADDFILKSTSYNQITIQILSDEGEYIDFNGLACFFALRFKIHRKVVAIRGNFYELVSRSTNLRLQNEIGEEEE